MNELLSLMADHVRKCLAERDMIARTIVCKRFGVDVNDIKTLKEVIASKKLSIVYSCENEVLGVSANNRWLYTIDGKVVGKEGRRFRIEKVKQY